MQQAAMVARVFRLDPVMVLAETSGIRRAARVAAALHVVETENAAQKKAQKG